MSNDIRHEKHQDGPKAETRFVQFSPDSIELIADSAGYPNLSKLVTQSLAEDASYRIRELVQACTQILRHSKRSKLTKDDLDLALKWSDVPHIFGHSTETQDFSYLAELEIYHPPDKLVDLTKDYPSDKNVDVYSPMKLCIQHLSSDSEDKLKSEVYSLYYEKIAQSLLSTVDSVVEVAITNLSENPKLQPLLPTFSVFLRNLVGLSYENCHIVKRIPQIFNAIIKNPYLNIEPEQQSFTELLQYLLLNYTEDTMTQDTYELSFTISQLLCQINQRRSTSDLVETISTIIASEDAKLTVQCRAMTVLNCLGSRFLDAAVKNSWIAVLSKYSASFDYCGNIYLRESIVATLVAVLRYKIGLIEQLSDLSDPLLKQMMREGEEMYRLGSEVLDCSTVRLCCFPQSLTRRLQNKLIESFKFHTDTTNEMYWTIKPKRRPTSREKWQFSRSECYSSFAQTYNLAEIFDYPNTTNVRSERITFRIRNWKQKPMQSLKKKTYTNSFMLASNFSLFCKTNLKPFSKCLFSHSASFFCNPVEVIL